MTDAPLRIAVAVHTFPVLTETFILEPIVHLLGRGHDVEILALYRGEASAEHPVVRDHGLMARARFLIDDRPGRGRLRKLRRGAAHFLRRPRVRVPWPRVIRDATRPSVLRVAPELVLAAAGADDRDRVRKEQTGDGARLGALFHFFQQRQHQPHAHIAVVPQHHKVFHDGVGDMFAHIAGGTINVGRPKGSKLWNCVPLAGGTAWRSETEREEPSRLREVLTVLTSCWAAPWTNSLSGSSLPRQAASRTQSPFHVML